MSLHLHINRITPDRNESKSPKPELILPSGAPETRAPANEGPPKNRNIEPGGRMAMVFFLLFLVS